MPKLHYTLLLSLLVACGSDDDDGGGSVTLAEFGGVFGSAYCAKAFECCAAAEIPQYFEGATFTDEAGCTQAYSGFFMALTSMYQASVSSGRLVFNESAAGTCLATMRGLACSAFAADQDALEGGCTNPFEGQLSNGMPCNFDEECQTEYCEGDVQFGTPMPGVCKDLPTSGQMCVDFECADGLQCDSGTCMALKADGASCFDDNECTSGGCNGAGQSTPGTCGAPMICNGQ